MSELASLVLYAHIAVCGGIIVQCETRKVEMPDMATCWRYVLKHQPLYGAGPRAACRYEKKEARP